jgi:hypothetical protein
MNQSNEGNRFRTRMAKVNPLRELQSASWEELSALMPSVLDKALKGEL